MIIPLQIKRNFFNETAFLFSCHALWKLLYFGNKTSYGNGNLYKDLLLVYLQIRIRKTSLFWLYNLMTSLWKPSITTFSRDMEIVSMQSYRAISSWMNTWCTNNSDQSITNQWRKRKKNRNWLTFATTNKSKWAELSGKLGQNSTSCSSIPRGSWSHDQGT